MVKDKDPSHIYVLYTYTYVILYVNNVYIQYTNITNLFSKNRNFEG